LGAFFTTRNIWAYLLIWVGMNIFESLLTVFFGFLALSNKGYRNIFRVPLRLITRRHAGLWRFVLSTNFNQSVRLASRELDVLVIGAILGAASTGVYKVAKHFASILPKLIDPVYQTIYPEFASLAAQKRFSDMKSVGVMVSVITGACGVFLWFVFVLFGKWFLAITAGPDYVSGWSVMVLIMFGYVIWGFAFCLPAGLLAIGRAERNLFVQLVSLSVFFPSLIFLLYRVGLFGAGIGQIIFFIVYFNLMLFFFSKNISRLEGAIID